MNIYELLLLITAFTLPLWRTGSYIISGITVIMAITYWVKNHKQITPIPKYFTITSLLYLFCVIITILFSPSYKIGFYFFVVEYTIILFLPFVFWPLFNDEGIAHRIIWFFALGLLISSLIIIYQGYGSNVNARPNGLIGHMNYAGAVAILTPVILAYIHGNTQINNKVAIVGYLIIAISVIGAVYNGTRAIFVDLGVVGLVYVLLFWRPTVKQATYVIVAIAILLFAVGAIKSSERIKDFNPNTMSIVTRFQMWEIGLNTWKNSPVLGVGIGQCPNIDGGQDDNGVWYTNLRDKKEWNDRAHLHNLAIQTLTETGLVGFIGMITYWGYIVALFLKYALKKRNLFARAGFCGVLGFLCHNLTDYTYGITSEAILVSILITLTLAQINNSKDSNEHEA